MNNKIKQISSGEIEDFIKGFQAFNTSEYGMYYYYNKTLYRDPYMQIMNEMGTILTLIIEHNDVFKFIHRVCELNEIPNDLMYNFKLYIESKKSELREIKLIEILE
jgi:hypothetical protein